VIYTATNAVVGSPIAVGASPIGVAVAQDGTRAYVTNVNDGTVSVIDTRANPPVVVGSPITVGFQPDWVAITPDGTRAYVTNENDRTVSVIDTTRDPPVVVGSPIPVGSSPLGVAITPDGKRAYVTNGNANTVSVIDTTANPPVVVASGRSAQSTMTSSGAGARLKVLSPELRPSARSTLTPVWARRAPIAGASNGEWATMIAPLLLFLEARARGGARSVSRVIGSSRLTMALSARAGMV
jgi:YVTN family beta-propeller protein